MTTLNKLIKNYSPILLNENEDRKNVIKAVKEWLLQKKRYQKEVGYETSYQSTKRYCTNQIISKFIIELEKELEEENKK